MVDVPVREPGPGQVLVAIEAAPVNPVDLATAEGVFHRMGLVHQPHHTGLGAEFAGTVAATGPGVDLPVGTRVAGLLGGFDRDRGAHAEQVVASAADLAVVPGELDPATASVVALNGLTAAQIADLLGEGGGRRLLVTGAAGTVGGYVTTLAIKRGWRVTGLARPADEAFVRGTGAEFTAAAEVGWDAVADCAALLDEAVALVAEGGVFVGVRPGFVPAGPGKITAHAVEVHPDPATLTHLLALAATGELPARVHAVVPLDQAAAAYRAVAAGGVRGKYVLRP
ncbi:MAG TPA: NADP-dependent oxidoreductase [Nocardia sp.]|uniref:NADP-dependent oxidoreductase n=1 Tax=Nocardia sp. TaxID=1821 RepID=UPI002B4B248F|nr:NADP-dependent oxidoreductase [Nocardia sp.]HLS77654.1 NADP-dependent oxidoreductase [Nocardia sp.]